LLISHDGKYIHALGLDVKIRWMVVCVGIIAALVGVIEMEGLE